MVLGNMPRVFVCADGDVTMPGFSSGVWGEGQEEEMLGNGRQLVVLGL